MRTSPDNLITRRSKHKHHLYYTHQKLRSLVISFMGIQNNQHNKAIIQTFNEYVVERKKKGGRTTEVNRNIIYQIANNACPYWPRKSIIVEKNVNASL